MLGISTQGPGPAVGTLYATRHGFYREENGKKVSTATNYILGRYALM